MADQGVPEVEDLSDEEPPGRRLSALGLTAIGFFWLAGGIYGNEELAQSAPPLCVLAFLGVITVVFALPTAMVTAELATAFPEEGGQVAWVQRACGSLIGGNNAFWVWFTCALDAAVYPQMAALYLDGVLHFGAFGRQMTALGIIALISTVNLLGLDWVAASQSVLCLLSMIPCLLYMGWGTHLLFDHPTLSHEGPIHWASLLSWALWLYSGFPLLGTMAGEVERPKVAYPVSIGILMPIVTLLNTLPLVISVQIDPDTDNYVSGHFSDLAGRLAGPWLQDMFVVGANVSLIGLYHSQILSAERSVVAFVDARAPTALVSTTTLPDVRQRGGSHVSSVPGSFIRRKSWRRRIIGWLRRPPSGGGVARGVVIFNGLVEACLTTLSYESIVVVEMMLFSLSNVLFLFAFLALCKWRVDGGLPAEFRLPGGKAAGVLWCIPSFLISCVTLAVDVGDSSWAVNATFLGVLVVGAVVTAVGQRCSNRGRTPACDVFLDEAHSPVAVGAGRREADCGRTR